MKNSENKPKLLLHICCVGCGVYVTNELKKNFEVELYFYNPNIFPQKEYDRRMEEAEKIAKTFEIPVIVEKYEHQNWLEKVRGYEKEPERGKRCEICYKDRLENTAKIAKKKGYSYFGTTLTTSPHKNAKLISLIGKELSKKFKLNYLDQDFKKNEGFKKSCEISKNLRLYRQDYCGCEFSIRK